MVKKKIENTEVRHAHKNIMWTGLSTLLITVIITPLIIPLSRLVCPKSEFGSCDMGWDIATAGVVYVTGIMLVVISGCMILIGLTLWAIDIFKNKK